MSSEVGAGIYETIDESSINPDVPISVPTPPRNENNDSFGSSSDDNSDPFPSDGYLNPYQPIAQEFEMHGYSSIVDKSDSDCSSSGKDDRVSVYLNPYQMIVPDQEIHEYLKVKADSCLEKNDVSDLSNQRLTGTYTDAHSFNTTGKYTGPKENKNQCEKMKSPVYEDNLVIDKNVIASIFIGDNEMTHDETQQRSDIESKQCIGINTDSSSNLKKVYLLHEVRCSDDLPEADCQLNVI